MNGGFDFQTLDGIAERVHTPFGDFVEKDVERRLVELDQIHPRILELSRLLIEDRGELPGKHLPVPVVLVFQRVHHRHRARQLHFDRMVGDRSEKERVLHEDAALTRHRADHARHRRFVPSSDGDCGPVGGVDTIEALDERGDEVLTGLLAV